MSAPRFGPDGLVAPAADVAPHRLVESATRLGHLVEGRSADARSDAAAAPPFDTHRSRRVGHAAQERPPRPRARRRRRKPRRAGASGIRRSPAGTRWPLPAEAASAPAGRSHRRSPSPSRRHPSGRRAPPPRRGVPGCAAPGDRTGCRHRPRRPRRAAGPPRGTRRWSRSGCRDGRPSAGRRAGGPRSAARVDVLLDVAGQQEPALRRSTPSSTTDTLLMPVPPSGGSSGTWPRIGHSTRIAISSTANRSPAAIDRRAGAPGRASRSSHAA